MNNKIVTAKLVVAGLSIIVISVNTIPVMAGSNSLTQSGAQTETAVTLNLQARNLVLKTGETLDTTATYDGESHSFKTVEEIQALIDTSTLRDGEDPSSVNVEYSTDGTMWTETPPAVTNANEDTPLTVYVRLSLNTYETVTLSGKLTVKRKDASIAVPKTTIDTTDDISTSVDAELIGFINDPIQGTDFSVSYNSENEPDPITYGNTYDNMYIINYPKEGSTYNYNNYNVTTTAGAVKYTNAAYIEVNNSLKLTGYSGTYDGQPHTVEVTGTENTDKVEYSTDNGTTWSVDVPSLTNVGTVNVLVRATVKGQVTEQTSKTATTISISKRELVVSANNVSIAQDSSKPTTYLATVTGLVDGEIINYIVTNTKASETAVGTYKNAIEVSGVTITKSGVSTKSNYNVSLDYGNFVILDGEYTALKSNLKVSSYSGTYDGVSHTLTVSGTTENTKILYSIDAGITWSEEIPTFKDVADSSYVYVRGYINGDESQVVTKRATVKISTAYAKIYANPATITYGDNDPTFTATVSGAVNNEQFDYTVERVDTDNTVGTHRNAIKVSLNADYPNYSITLRSASFTIKRSEQANAVKNISVTGYAGYYDGMAHGVTVNSDSSDIKIEYSTDGGASWSGSCPEIVNVEDSTTVYVRATADDGTTKTVSTAIKIRRAPVTIVVDPVEIVQGESIPELSATIDGVIGNDVIDYDISYSGSSLAKIGKQSGVLRCTLNGTYPNYTITIKNGTLTVTDDGIIDTIYPENDQKYDNENAVKGTVIKLKDDSLDYIDAPADTIIDIAKFDADINETAAVNFGEEKENVEKENEDGSKAESSNNSDKKSITTSKAVPYIIGSIVAGAIAVGMGITGGFNALWLLLLGLLFKKKRKHWHGLLTYADNFFIKVKGETEGIEDYQDILNKDVTLEELKKVVESEDVETILPAKTKMSIDVDGQEQEFDADEDLFYENLVDAHGHIIVTIFNPIAKINIILEADLI